ncbi:hypothetical protein Bca4012_046441 [Brassica carinata]
MECLQDSLEVIEAWKVEVKCLGKHSHPNLVKFLGYCCEDKKSLLVFEYLHQGTLDHHIHGKKELLPWATRVKIAIGTAQGLAFIHSINNSSVYFELRMHNIMLDEVMTFLFIYNIMFMILETKEHDYRWWEEGSYAWVPPTFCKNRASMSPNKKRFTGVCCT